MNQAIQMPYQLSRFEYSSQHEIHLQYINENGEEVVESYAPVSEWAGNQNQPKVLVSVEVLEKNDFDTPRAFQLKLLNQETKSEICIAHEGPHYALQVFSNEVQAKKLNTVPMAKMLGWHWA